MICLRIQHDISPLEWFILMLFDDRKNPAMLNNNQLIGSTIAQNGYQNIFELIDSCSLARGTFRWLKYLILSIS